MTKAEALKALDEGATLTHDYFSSDEWMKKSGVLYEFEDGVKVDPEDFWADRRGSGFETGWSIVS